MTHQERPETEGAPLEDALRRTIDAGDLQVSTAANRAWTAEELLAAMDRLWRTSLGEGSG